MRSDLWVEKEQETPRNAEEKKKKKKPVGKMCTFRQNHKGTLVSTCADKTRQVFSRKWKIKMGAVKQLELTLEICWKFSSNILLWPFPPA